MSSKYHKYGFTKDDQLRNMAEKIEIMTATIESLKKDKKFERELVLTYAESNSRIIKNYAAVIEKLPVRIYKEQIQDKIYDKETPGSEVNYYRTILEQDTMVQKLFGIPSHQTFFVKTIDGPLVYCVKLSKEN